MTLKRPVIIVCGNPGCGKRLQINEPEKFTRGVVCPNCKFRNSLPEPESTPKGTVADDDLRTAVFSAEDVPTGISSRPPVPPVPSVPGWLIVKDERTAAKTFALHQGVNTIGRRSSQHVSDHMIDSNDHLMSRPHCTIEVRLNRLGVLDFILRDGVTLPQNAQKSSLNGTYLNANEKRLGDQDRIYLRDRDMIQIGMTKLVLITGYRAESAEQAGQEVSTMEFGKTIDKF
jgi:hypothetical protein